MKEELRRQNKEKRKLFKELQDKRYRQRKGWGFKQYQRVRKQDILKEIEG